MAETDRILTSFIAILIGVVLIPIIASTVADANVSGTTATIITLIPVFFGLGILLLAVRAMTGGR